MITLRDGTEVFDKRLDRLRQFDQRSRSFPIREAVEPRIRSMTWRCHAWLDQGVEGACVGFAVSHHIAARPVEDLRVSDASAREIYREAQKIDPWPGEAYEGTSVLAGVKVAHKRRFFDEYRWAFGLHDLQLGLSSGPAILGVDWYEGMYQPDDQGFIRVQGERVGGHAILCRGINVPGRYFTLRNSWGDAWGINAEKGQSRKGDCRITFDDMDRLLADQGEAVFFVRNRRPQAA